MLLVVTFFTCLFGVSSAACSVDVGQNDNPLLQCKLPSYWQNGNATCNSSNWNFVERSAITSKQKDYDSVYWPTVMWFSDSVWAGTLLAYQQVLQHGFTYAVLDLHDKWGHTSNVSITVDSLDVDDVYVNVTFFLGFCLLRNDDCTAFSV